MDAIVTTGCAMLDGERTSGGTGRGNPKRRAH
jgi:hypothetical protein